MRNADLIAAELEAAAERRVMGLLSPHADLMREAAEVLRTVKQAPAQFPGEPLVRTPEPAIYETDVILDVAPAKKPRKGKK